MRSFVSDNLNLFNEAVNVSITMPWNRIFEANFDVSGNKLNETVLKKHFKILNEKACILFCRLF